MNQFQCQMCNRPYQSSFTIAPCPNPVCEINRGPLKNPEVKPPQKINYKKMGFEELITQFLEQVKLNAHSRMERHVADSGAADELRRRAYTTIDSLHKILSAKETSYTEKELEYLCILLYLTARDISEYHEKPWVTQPKPDEFLTMPDNINNIQEWVDWSSQIDAPF